MVQTRRRRVEGALSKDPYDVKLRSKVVDQENGTTKTAMSNGDVIIGDSSFYHAGKWNGYVQIKNRRSLYKGNVIDNVRYGPAVLKKKLKDGRSFKLKAKFVEGVAQGEASALYGNLTRVTGWIEDGDFNGPVRKIRMKKKQRKDSEGNTKNYLVPGKVLFEGNVKGGRAIGECKVPQMNREGHYLKGYLNGFGKVQYKSGSVYEGEFKKNKRHGQGKLTLKDGTVIEGLFTKNKRVRNSYTITKPDEVDEDIGADDDVGAARNSMCI